MADGVALRRTRGTHREQICNTLLYHTIIAAANAATYPVVRHAARSRGALSIPCPIGKQTAVACKTATYASLLRLGRVGDLLSSVAVVAVPKAPESQNHDSSLGERVGGSMAWWTGPKNTPVSAHGFPSAPSQVSKRRFCGFPVNPEAQPLQPDPSYGLA